MESRNERTLRSHPDGPVDGEGVALEREAEQVCVPGLASREQDPDQAGNPALVWQDGRRCKHLQLRRQEEARTPCRLRTQATLEKGDRDFEGGRENRSRMKRSNGVMECWSLGTRPRRGALAHYSTTPLLH